MPKDEDLVRPSADCVDGWHGHIFDYGAHAATVDNPYPCIVEGCEAYLVPVMPITKPNVDDTAS